MLISGQWLNSDALPPEPDPPASLECANVADDIFFGIVDADAIEPKIETRDGDMKPFLGNITMESYGKSNCTGCHARAVINNSGGTTYNTDFMFFPSINVLLQDNNFMTHRVSEPSAMCELPADPAIIEFDLTGGAAGPMVAMQSMDLLVGIEFPENLPDPVISARDFQDHVLPWVRGDVAVALVPDEACEPGLCQVDQLYPPLPGQRWLQLRSAPDLEIGAEMPLFATHIVMAFPDLNCGDIDPLELRLWISDNSQAIYANQVDGGFLQRTLFLLPEPPIMPPDLHHVPTLGRTALSILFMLLLGFGLWASRGR